MWCAEVLPNVPPDWKDVEPAVFADVVNQDRLDVLVANADRL